MSEILQTFPCSHMRGQPHEIWRSGTDVCRGGDNGATQIII